MRSILVILIHCCLWGGGLFPELSYGQELVPNGGFEITNGLPCGPVGTGQAITTYLKDWTSPNTGSPDLLSMKQNPVCWSFPGDSTLFSTQGCWPGPVTPHSGDNMIGISLYHPAVSGCGGGVFSEYIQVQLSVPLTPEWYCLEFWAALSPNAALATNNLGIYLSTKPISSSDCQRLPGRAVVVSRDVVGEPGKWHNFSDVFFADSAYRYLIIGKFEEGGSLDVDDLNGCRGLGAYYFIDDVGVRRMPDEGYLGPDVSTCLGDTVTINGAIPDATYLWQDGFTGPIYRAVSSGTYSLEVTVLSCPFYDEVEVEITPPPMPDLGGDTFLCEGGSQLFYNVEAEGDAFLWQDGTRDPFYVVQEPGQYWVEVMNECGIEGDTIEVGLEDCECHIQLPSAFTPNGDGLNDYFGPIYDCLVLQSQLKVFNRWGKTVFVNDAIRDRWDGRSQGRMVQEGVYFWVFEYEGWIQGKPRKRRLTGSVTILR